MSIPNVGKVFNTADEFLGYLESLKFGLWRPRFLVVHHTGSPDLKTWEGWQTRVNKKTGQPAPVTDEQWMSNLADYYARERGWSAGPHFFVTPSHICVLSPPTARGVHAASFNSISWGLETTGDFDAEPFAGKVKDMLVGALAAIHIATGMALTPFERGVRGLHFHRDDPKTNKTCPGKKVSRESLVADVQRRIEVMTQGDHDDEHVIRYVVPASPAKPVKPGTSAAPPTPKLSVVYGVVTTPDLNVRAAATAKAPVVSKLGVGEKVTVLGSAMNGSTKWLQIDSDDANTDADGWVAAQYVKIG